MVIFDSFLKPRLYETIHMKYLEGFLNGEDIVRLPKHAIDESKRLYESHTILSRPM